MRIIDPVAAGLGGARRLVKTVLDPVTRGWSVVLAASVARLSLGFIASVVLTRTLGPAAFGVYAVLGVIGNVAGVAADPGLTGAAVKRIASAWPAEAELARNRSRDFILLRVGVAAVVALLAAVILAPAASSIFGPAMTGGLVVLALVGVVATAACGAFNAVLQATASFGRLALVLLVNPGLTALLAVALARAGRLDLVTALVLLGITPSVAAAVAGGRKLPFKLDLRAADLRKVATEGRALSHFGRWLWLSDLLAALAAQLDLLLLGWLGGANAAVGTYALALNLASKADVVNHSLYTVLLPTASALRDPGGVRHYVRRGLVRSVLIAGGLAVLFPLAGPLIPIIYGSSFVASVSLFRGLLVVAIFDVVVTPLILLAFYYERPKLLAVADASRLVTLVLGAALLIPTDGADGAVWAKLASRVVGAAIVLVALWRGDEGARRDRPIDPI